MASESAKATFSIPSFIAIGSAIASFAAGPFWGFILAVVAIIFGAIGVLFSLAPSVRGGLMSILSLIAGALGIVIAIVKALMGPS